MLESLKGYARARGRGHVFSGFFINVSLYDYMRVEKFALLFHDIQLAFKVIGKNVILIGTHE